MIESVVDRILYPQDSIPSQDSILSLCCMIWVHCPHINIDQGGLRDAGKHASIILWLSNSHKRLIH
jgi:hypothetical protein